MAVLIVAYRSADKLEKCIRAAEQHLPATSCMSGTTRGPPVRTYAASRIVCSTSTGIQVSENIGFAAAVNRLAAMVPGRDLLLLNPDAELDRTVDVDTRSDSRAGTAAAAPMIWEPGVEDRSVSLLSAQTHAVGRRASQNDAPQRSLRASRQESSACGERACRTCTGHSRRTWMVI